MGGADHLDGQKDAACRVSALAASCLLCSCCRGKSFLTWFLCAVGLGVYPGQEEKCMEKERSKGLRSTAVLADSPSSKEMRALLQNRAVYRRS